MGEALTRDWMGRRSCVPALNVSDRYEIHCSEASESDEYADVLCTNHEEVKHMLA